MEKEFRQEMKIPKDRVGALIGKKGEIKKYIEGKANLKLEIDSKSGDVALMGEDSVALYETKNIIGAIGRGFAPETAFQLFNEKNVMEIIDINDYSGKSQKKFERLKGRVIGSEGKARKMIEDMTETNISVYGKTIGIIGELEHASMARRAVEQLLAGSPHGTVYRWLENKRRDLHRRVFEENGPDF